MSPEERQLLSATYQLSEENNKILRGLRRSQRWQTAGWVIKWALIIGVSFGAYFYLQPFIEGLKPTIDSIVKTYQSFSSLLPR